MGAHSSHHEPLDRNSRSTSFRRAASLRQSKAKGNRTSPRAMDKLRRSFRSSFRRRKEPISEASKPHLWQTDEMDVRAGTCFFHVKYLGCVEVFESRGMQVCEEALRVLKNSRRRSVKAILYVSGDGLRVVEDDTKGLIVDQTIEKVSFCAPDRTHDRGFSYICRDGTTRRWMCHGFLALKESGERLSHAVGCAFAVCLERKQKRDKECSVTMNFDLSNSTFTRTGSFRQQPLTEKFQDPTNAMTTTTTSTASNTSNGSIPATTVININNNINTSYNRKENIPVRTTPKISTHAIERPHASVSLLQRQGSFRGLSHLNHASPFKRQLSLRLSDLPSNAERTRSHSLELSYDSRLSNVSQFLHTKTAVSPIPEISPTNTVDSNANATSETSTVSDQVSAMCQQLSQGLSFLSKNEDLINSKSSQLISAQPLSVKDIFAQKLVECSSQLVELQPVEDSCSSFFAEKSCSDDTKLENILLSNLRDVSPSQNMSATLVNTTGTTTSSTLIENGADLSSNHRHSSTVEDIPLTPPATPPLSTDSTSQLPKPEQWLGKVTQLTLSDPATSAVASSVAATAVPVPSPPFLKRNPALNSHMRTHSLGSAETVLHRATVAAEKSSNDTFSIDWASLSMDEKPAQSKNTNPFLSNNSLSGPSDSTPVKMFEVQM